MTSIFAIGDPHTGKIFRTGVPLDRRGEREAMVWADFIAALNQECDINVCVGDLFDKRVVPPEVVIAVANAYIQAMAARPKTIFLVIRGNHDASRDASQASSFDLFRAIMRGFANFHVVCDEPLVLNDRLLFVPWHPFKTAIEMLEPAKGRKFEQVFGHWDIRDFGVENSNLIPIALLKDMTDTVYSGHDHTPQLLVMEGVTVHMTGSLQPYSHGEDPKGRFYVTLTREELDVIPAGLLHDKCVRVLLKPTQTLPDEPIDCLQLTVKKVAEDGTEDDETVELDPFDLKGLFDTAMNDAGLDAGFSTEIWTKFQGMKDAQVA
jgi:DNA repair exonuclease SbcCD nuclease subunit